MPVYKIAIAGASTLLGRELKEALSESPLAAASPVLLDEEEAQGQLDQVEDEGTFRSIAGASTLLGRELKEALSESPLAAASPVLLDEEEAQGQLDQVEDEVTFVQAIGADAFERVDFTFFAGTENLTRKHWREALGGGFTVLDLSGALDQETGLVVRAPWLDFRGLVSEAVAPDLFTPAVCPAHPAALALALVLERLQQAAPARSVPP